MTGRKGTAPRTWDILFCGTGGQGVLKAAEVCGWAAIDAGFHVKKSEVHGMAQRGGSVESHLRFGDRVWSPLIPEGRAGFLVAFHHGEHERMRHFLAPDGVDIMRHWNAMMHAVQDKRFLNTFLLGALSRYLPLSEDNWRKALTDAFRERKLEENLRIFAKGREAAQ